MTLQYRSYLRPIAFAALTCALVLLASATGESVEGKTKSVAVLGSAATTQKESIATGEAARVLGSSFVRPVDITDWAPETDPKRLEPALLANLSVAICDDHFPAGSLARAQIEEGLALFTEANGVNINITYVNATQYVPHKLKSTLFSSPPSTVLQIDYVDNGVDENGIPVDPGIFPCHPTFGDISCSSWSGNTCRYSSVYDEWESDYDVLHQAAVISINPYCTEQDSLEQRWTTNLNKVFKLDAVSHEMGHVVGMKHADLRPFTSNVFQTKMIQPLGQLSAYDLAFLTHYYPTNLVNINADYSASRVLRLEQADGSVEGGVGDFADYNPKNLYASSGSYYSCRNAERPVYNAQFFDKSPSRSETDVDVRFVVSTPPGTWIEMHRQSVPLSASSAKFNQIGVRSPPLILSTAAFGLAVAPATSLAATLQFETNPDHDNAEIELANNNVAMPLHLYRERSLCPDRPQRVTPLPYRFAGDNFSSAIAAAGDRVVSGAKDHGYYAFGLGYVSDAGGAWVHKVNSETGETTMEALLVPTGVNAYAANDLFGSAVAMTDNLVAVGAPGQDFDAAGANRINDAGAVYLFRRHETTWTLEAKVTPPAGRRFAFDGFGSAVALSSDGLTLAVGAPFHDYFLDPNFAGSAGAVYLFRYIDDEWHFSQKLGGVDPISSVHLAGELFGSSLALASGYLAVGAPGQDYDQLGLNRQEDAGAVYVFSEVQSDSDMSYTFHKKLVPSGINARFAFDHFGGALALYRHSSERYTLLVGAYGHDYDVAGSNYVDMAGAAYVFTAETDESSWVLRQKLTGEPGTPHRRANDYFGKAVGLFGTRLIVGAEGQDYEGDGTGYLSGAGAIYVYEPLSAYAWRLINKAGAAGAGLNAREVNEAFGSSIALTDEIFAVGAPAHSYDDSGLSSVAAAGATFVYFLP